MTVKINPATGLEHKTLPYSKENHEWLKELDKKVNPKNGGEGDLDDEIFTQFEKEIGASTAFAIVNMENRLNVMHSDDIKDMYEELSNTLFNAGKKYDDSLAFWFTELVQNAMDASWANSETTELILNISEENIEFTHNGRPPHYRNKRLGHDEDGSEFSKMIRQGSTKRGSLSVEGQFGIGFKFWSYHFGQVKLCAEGWGCSWGKDPKTLHISSSDTINGLRLLFSEADQKTKISLKEYCENPQQLIVKLGRLMSGISMLERNFRFEFMINGSTFWEIKHNVKNNEETKFMEVSNQCTGNIQNIHLPEKMLLFKLDELESYPAELQEKLVDSWAAEINFRSKSQVIKKLLQKNGWLLDDSNLEEYAEITAIETLKDFRMLIAIDIETYEVNSKPHHYLLHSMFPIGEPSVVRQKGTTSRLNLVSQFSLEPSRTRLKDDKDVNTALGGLLSYLLHMMLDRLSKHEIRDTLSISEHLYHDIVNFQKDEGTRDFLKLVEKSAQTFDTELDWKSRRIRDTAYQYAEVLFPGTAYPSKNDAQFNSWKNSYTLRQEIRDMLNSEDEMIVEWASAFIHEFESCFTIGETIHPVDSYFVNKEHFLKSRADIVSDSSHKYEIMKSISKGYEIEFHNLFKNWNPNYLPKPKSDISKTIAKTLKSREPFNKEWPYWLPIPVKESGTKKHPVWKLPSELKQALVFKNPIDWDDDDKLVESIYDLAKEHGLNVFELSREWEPLFRDLEQIRGIPLLKGDSDAVLQRSVTFLTEKAQKTGHGICSSSEKEPVSDLKIITSILKEKIELIGQNSIDRWPFFMENSDGDLLMISEPSEKWNHVLLSTNDLKAVLSHSRRDDKIIDDLSVHKTLWWLKGNEKQPSQGFISLYEGAKNGSPVLYVHNLDKPESQISHLLDTSEKDSQFLAAYNETVLGMTTDKEGKLRTDAVEFSPVRLAYDDSNQILTQFNCELCHPLRNTKAEVLANVKKKLPGLPSFLNAKYIPSKKKGWTVEMPQVPKSTRSIKDYTTQPDEIHGFMRHIFRIPNEAPQNHLRNFVNNADTESLAKDGTLQGKEPDWNDLLSVQSSQTHHRNYALLIRTISPEAAAFEILENNQSPTEIQLKNALLLASHSHSPRHKSISNPSKLKRGGDTKYKLRVPFSLWFAYWTQNINTKRELVFEPLNFNLNANQLVLTSHFDHELLDGFKSPPNLVAGFTSSERDLFANSVLIAPASKDANNAVGTARVNWSEHPIHGGLIKMMGNLLSEKNILPLNDSELTEKLTPQTYGILKHSLLELEYKTIDFTGGLSGDELKVSNQWLIQPHLDVWDEIIHELITKAVKSQNITLLHAPSLLLEHYSSNQRVLTLSLEEEQVEKVVSDYEDFVNNRLLAWRVDFSRDQFAFAEGDFEQLIVKMFSVEKSDSHIDLNLASRLRKSDNKQMAQKSLKECIAHRLFRIDDSSANDSWRAVKATNAGVNTWKGMANSKLILFSDQVRRFMNPFNGFQNLSDSNQEVKRTSFPQWGFGIKPGVPVVQLSLQETVQVKAKNQYLSEIPVLVIDDLFEKSYDSLCKYFKNVNEHGEYQDHSGFRCEKENWQFVANAFTYIAAYWYQKNQHNNNPAELKNFLGKLGVFKLDLKKTWEDEIHEGSNVTYGNGGWSFSSEGELVSSKDDLGTKGMTEKVKILKEMLDYVAKKLGNNVESIFEGNRRFKDIFNIQDEELTAIHHFSRDSPLSDEVSERHRWFNDNTISVTDEVFENLLRDRSNWMKWTNAVKLLSPRVNSEGMLPLQMARWFRKEHNRNRDAQGILKRLYPNLSCTVVKPAGFARILDGEEEVGQREIIRLQGHERDTGLPFGKTGIDKKQYENILQHLGNMLYVSTQMAAEGKLNNGWRIKPSPDSTNPDFINWLTRSSFAKLKSFWEEYPDCDYILLPSIVYPRNFDSKCDSPVDLIVHKLHLLYIISFHLELVKRLNTK